MATVCTVVLHIFCVYFVIFYCFMQSVVKEIDCHPDDPGLTVIEPSTSCLVV